MYVEKLHHVFHIKCHETDTFVTRLKFISISFNAFDNKV